MKATWGENEIPIGPYTVSKQARDLWIWRRGKPVAWLAISKTGDLDLTVFEGFKEDVALSHYRRPAK